MIRLFVLFLVIAALATGAAWFSDNPGDVAVTWHGQRYEMSLAVALAGVVALAILLGMVWTLIRFTLRLPSLVALASRSRQHRRGLQAATKGLVAVGSGDGAGAQRHAADARRLLGKGPLTLLLDAQAAQLAGDRERARKAFEAMTHERDTRILGLRGLHVEAKRAGNADAARSAAQQAVAIAPTAAWANEAVLSDRFAERDWEGARTALERSERLRVLEKSTARRQRASLLTAEAIDALATNPSDALRKAQEAATLAPDLAPAAALAGRLLGEKGELRKATKILETAWRAQPQPDIADAYVHLRTGDSTLDQLRRAEALARLMPRDPESALTVAQAALAAHDSAKARAALEPLLAGRPTARACLLMARIEEHDGHPGLAKGWLARAARAPRDKAWVADGHVSAVWSPVSPVTGRLDAMEWREPPQDAATALPGHDDLSIWPVEASEAVEPDLLDTTAASAPTSEQSQELEAPAHEMPATEPAPPANAAVAVAPVERAAATAALAPETSTPPEPGQRLSPTPVTPVVFPVPHAPDDPGPRPANGQARRWRVFGG